MNRLRAYFVMYPYVVRLSGDLVDTNVNLTWISVEAALKKRRLSRITYYVIFFYNYAHVSRALRVRRRTWVRVCLGTFLLLFMSFRFLPAASSGTRPLI